MKRLVLIAVTVLAQHAHAAMSVRDDYGHRVVLAAPASRIISLAPRAARLTGEYSGRKPVRVFYEVWRRPIVTVNGAHLISKVIRLCGGVNVLARLPQIAPEIDREAVLRADPQVIVASGPDDMRPAWLDAWKAFPGLAAAARGQLYTIPPDLIERQSMRILDGAERMCRVLQAAQVAVAKSAPAAPNSARR
jgi:iron complex transport system substrate-binding protein